MKMPAKENLISPLYVPTTRDEGKHQLLIFCRRKTRKKARRRNFRYVIGIFAIKLSFHIHTRRLCAKNIEHSARLRGWKWEIFKENSPAIDQDRWKPSRICKGTARLQPPRAQIRRATEGCGCLGVVQTARAIIRLSFSETSHCLFQLELYSRL